MATFHDDGHNVKLGVNHHKALKMLSASTFLTQKQLLEEALYLLLHQTEYANALGNNYADIIDSLEQIDE